MNLALKLVSTVFKDKMAKIISTQTTNHPVPNDLVLIEDLPYEGPDGTPLAADVYRPKGTSDGPLPIAVFIHGGGFLVGSRKANRVFAELLAQRGYVVFVPEYRLLDQTKGVNAVSDVVAGLSYLKAHAREFYGDLNNVLMIGESAGGFLAVYATAVLASPLLQRELGIEVPNLSMRGLACFAGMLYTAGCNLIGLVYRRDMFGDLLKEPDFMKFMSPDYPIVESSLPPVLQVTSGADFLKNHTMRFNEALAMAGHDHRLIYYKEGDELTHAFPSLRPELPQSREVLEALDGWYRRLPPQTLA